MIVPENPNRPVCEACGDECSDWEMSIDHPAHCLVCASKLDAPPLRPDLAHCEDCGHVERVQHLSVIHPTCCVWCATVRIAAEQASGLAAE